MNRREKAAKFSRELANVLDRLRPDTATASPNCSNLNAECSKLAAHMRITWHIGDTETNGFGEHRHRNIACDVISSAM
jgi:hypothetical protein